jgi:hypothetical protein
MDIWFSAEPRIVPYPAQASQRVKMNAVASAPRPVVRSAFKNCGQFETKLENQSLNAHRRAGDASSQKQTGPIHIGPVCNAT